jgi:cholesterol oxidase
VTFAELTPYYEKVRRMLRLTGIPAGQETARFQLLERAAAKLGWEKRFERVPLAISFDEHYSYGLPDPIDEQHSKRFVNDQGVTQGTCVHLGNCDIGCDVHAKNTLDLNYVPQAERHGAEVRPLHLVRSVEPAGNGYRVHWDHIVGKRLEPGSAEADRVVLAAGSLGSTEILLRCRDLHGTLPHLSDRLGRGWSGNANFLAPAIYPKSVRIDQGIGPTISAGLDFMDGAVDGQSFFVEDDGFPNVLLNALRAKGGIFGGLAANRLQRGLDEKNPLDQVMVWLGEGLDAADGRLYLGRKRLQPWQRTLRLDWDVSASRAVIDAIEQTHRQLTAVEGGKFRSPLWWRWFKALVTVHPLGGCAMGTSAEDGVVDHKGEVFGHPGLFVADGALLPKPTGRNPSMTIGALAERVAALMTRG